MAWSSAELSSTVRALAAANKPMLVGTNRLRGLAAASIEVNILTGSFAEADDTLASTLKTWLADGYTHKAVSSTTADATVYFLFDLGALVTFDVVAILGHNFGTIGGLTVTIEVADASTFAGATQIATASPGTSTKRLVWLALDHTATAARQYTAQYVRIKIAKGSTFIPTIPEIIIGTRRQLKHNPNVPYDPTQLRSTVEESTTPSQITSRYVYARGQRLLNAELNPSESTYRDDLYGFWTSDIEDGTKPFLWIPTPASNSQDAPLMFVPPELQFPWRGPAERALTLVAAEQGSQFVRLET